MGNRLFPSTPRLQCSEVGLTFSNQSPLQHARHTWDHPWSGPCTPRTLRARSCGVGALACIRFRARSERTLLALVSQGLRASYSMDNNDPGRYLQLLVELYAPLSGLFDVWGRGEERLPAERCRGLWGPGLSAHLHRSVVMWRCRYGPVSQNYSPYEYILLGYSFTYPLRTIKYSGGPNVVVVSKL